MKSRPCSLFVLSLLLAASGVGRVHGALFSASLAATFTNPAPSQHLNFGYGVAGIGTNKVLIGATDSANRAGAAHLFTVDGTLLHTFTNPNSASGDYFGVAMAAVGREAVVIGSPFEWVGAVRPGAAYLFSTNGVLRTAFTNPAPTGYNNFGVSIATIGADKVLIGANGDNTGATGAGAAYLFGTNGMLLTTFTNPTPASDDSFGIAVAAINAETVLIGAQGDGGAGAAHLYRLDGVLLTTFTNPSPYGYFGNAVAAVGTDKVLIGAMLAEAGLGAAYLFSTNGTLLTTFTNPKGIPDWFGYVVAGMGEDKVLITAFGEFSAAGKGVAYLFSTNGSLLTTLTNPVSANNDQFGYAATALGTDQVIIGAVTDGTGATQAGAAYLFSLSLIAAPRLGIEHVGDGNVRLSWPLTAADFLLEQTTAIAPPPQTNSWTQVLLAHQTNDTVISVVVTPDGRCFYRLRKP